MFQFIKRVHFISKHNFPNPLFGDGAKMHRWLQNNGWPANKFVDLLMAGSEGIDNSMLRLKFQLMTTGSYLVITDKDREALENLHKMFNKPEYARHDKDNLITMLREMKYR